MSILATQWKEKQINRFCIVQVGHGRSAPVLYRLNVGKLLRDQVCDERCECNFDCNATTAIEIADFLPFFCFARDIFFINPLTFHRKYAIIGYEKVKRPCA